MVGVGVGVVGVLVGVCVGVGLGGTHNDCCSIVRLAVKSF
jgi:hypothetical protein